MSYIDEEGNEINSLMELADKMSVIKTIEVEGYCFSLGRTSQVDRVSVLSKLQWCHENKAFSPTDFAEYLRVRRIPFRVKWMPNRRYSALKNLRHSIYAAKISRMGVVI